MYGVVVSVEPGFPSIAEQQAYWERREKEQDDLAADTRMVRLSERDYDNN